MLASVEKPARRRLLQSRSTLRQGCALGISKLQFLARLLLTMLEQ